MQQPVWANDAFTGFCLDSRKIQTGQIFVLLQGYANPDLDQARNYIESALAHGAIGVMTEIAALQKEEKVLYLPDLRQKIGHLQQQFLQLQQPQALAKVVAVTGTNGKTTISRLIAELLTFLNHKTAVMGTTGNGILPHLMASTHTTLDALQLQQHYYQYSQQGAEYLSLEASSHGLDQGRLAGLPIEVAVYSNLSRDHLDYHGDLSAYAKAKAQLFQFPSLQYAVLNLDDASTEIMRHACENNSACPVVRGYSTKDLQADYFAQDIEFSLQGANFNLIYQGQSYSVQSPLLGQFNVSNVLAAIAAVHCMGFDLQDICQFVPQLQGAAGRMQTFTDGEQQQARLFIVDYAHTPDALQQVLTSLRHHVEGQLWAVFGCGGDRDRGKRPLMTQAALDFADKIILTSDNPRTENLDQIFSDMVDGCVVNTDNVFEIRDRRLAIRYAVQQAQAGDIVVIAGKGHEDYQDIDGVKHWFDDAVEVRAALDAQYHAVPPTQQV
ncbi:MULTISPECIES: UDP-N-acetylmuramoyl-L-alanyl-D-glutamate--2,6-diaminopimelate ligase [unclassified Acinetobacter]|uniref:UDP-N-acetylmuramoyl-L-alanyl-D-glutamate--2, 6-diaminopimelate ligase n=1 Tax=unclassified Acinetobacter TaxID=196816 RepID=UPI0035B78247